VPRARNGVGRDESQIIMGSILKWFGSAIATAAVVANSFQWFGRPVALMVHQCTRHPHRKIFDQLTHIPDPLIPIAVVEFIVLGVKEFYGRSLSNYQAAAFVCSLSVVFAESINDQTKFIFGRTWPEAWLQNNPSFIGDGTYGFNLMHGGSAYQSFPSGQMAATCAVVSVLWIWYPQLRWVGAIAVVAVAVGLVGANYHFLSDVIAGAFVGTMTGWMVTAIWSVRNAM
jgi:membrane-associated phospholipid phosphatase